MLNLFEHLKSKTYPGRGIVVFHPKEQNKLFCGYWIMGRSENSRNRVFENFEGNIRTIPADDSKVEDPHLIIYNARVAVPDKDVVVITNGDQTDTIVNFIFNSEDEKLAHVEALMTRTFEDDAPNFTPRISTVINAKTGEVAFSSLKCSNAQNETAQRSFSFYEKVDEGEGYLLTTYVDDGSPLPSSSSEPIKITCEAQNLNVFKELLWESLNDENKISLYVEEIDLKTSKFMSEYINKYERVEA